MRGVFPATDQAARLGAFAGTAIPLSLGIVCWLLAGVLAWAGAIKVLDPASFAENIMNFRLVSWPVAAALALYLPWLELVVAVGLLIPRWRIGSLCMACVLFAGFSVILAVTWWRGVDVTCGCFGVSGSISVAWAFLRALALTVLAGALAYWISPARESDSR